MSIEATSTRKTNKTCKSCPWLREANPNKLGRRSALIMVDAIERGQTLGCHCKDDDVTVIFGQEEQRICRGSEISRRGGDEDLMTTNEFRDHYQEQEASEWPWLHAYKNK